MPQDTAVEYRRCRTVTMSDVRAEVQVSVLATTAEQAESVAKKALDFIVLETIHETEPNPTTITDYQTTESGACISFTIKFDPMTV